MNSRGLGRQPLQWVGWSRERVLVMLVLFYRCASASQTCPLTADNGSSSAVVKAPHLGKWFSKMNSFEEHSCCNMFVNDLVIQCALSKQWRCAYRATVVCNNDTKKKY